MKNKTSRTNSMKLKKVIAASLAVFILFAFTGCKTSSGSATTESSKQEDTSTTDSSSSGDLNEKLNDLYQQENQIFADHKNVWDKVFGFMSKNIDDGSMDKNYADFLANTIEANKDSFSEEEHATLSKDIETIRGIEEEIKAIEAVEPTKVVGISINLKNAELDLDTEYFEHKYDLPVEDVYNNGASKLLDAILDYLGE